MFLGVAILSAFTIFALVPESPQYNHERGNLDDFQEARQALSQVAAFNGVTETRPGQAYSNFKFVNEAKLM